MTTIAVIGAGSVGRSLGTALADLGHQVTHGVRAPDDARHDGLRAVATVADAVAGAEAVILAVPAAAVPDALAAAGLVDGQVVLDATNAVGGPVPGGAETMGALVAASVPDGVAVAKAFNTIGAEHLGDGRTEHGPLFLPVAGDPEAVTVALTLAGELGFDAVDLGGPDHFGMVEDHARLWIHLAFARGWGRRFGFTVVRR